MVTVLPLVAACIASVFAADLVRQYIARRRAHALAWAASLVLFGVASAAVTVGVTAGWSAPVFAVYWVGGALLNVPLLAVGQLQLLDAPRTRLWWMLGLVAAVAAVAATGIASFDLQALRDASEEHAIPAGRDVLADSVAYQLVAPFNASFVIVVAGSVWSAIRSRRWEVLLIAVGVSIAAAGSSAVGSGRDALFSILLALGVATMYTGFRAAVRLPARAPREREVTS